MRLIDIAALLILLTNYTFPGNVGELENLIERSVALSPANILKARFQIRLIWRDLTFFVKKKIFC